MNKTLAFVVFVVMFIVGSLIWILESEGPAFTIGFAARQTLVLCSLLCTGVGLRKLHATRHKNAFFQFVFVVALLAGLFVVGPPAPHDELFVIAALVVGASSLPTACWLERRTRRQPAC